MYCAFLYTTLVTGLYVTDQAEWTGEATRRMPPATLFDTCKMILALVLAFLNPR